MRERKWKRQGSRKREIIEKQEREEAAATTKSFVHVPLPSFPPSLPPLLSPILCE